MPSSEKDWRAVQTASVVNTHELQGSSELFMKAAIQ